MIKIKNVKLPESPTKELAELLGAHCGDGCLQYYKKNNDYSWRIYGNKNKDEEYINYLSNLIVKCFGIMPKKYYILKRNTVCLTIHSKVLVLYFMDIFNLPVGKKEFLGKMRLMRKKIKYSNYFIRGMFDTNGCVVIQKFDKYRYKVIKICTSDRELVHYVTKELFKLGFHPHITNGSSMKGEYQIIIKRKSEIGKWIDVIGSSNPRNLCRLNENI